MTISTFKNQRLLLSHRVIVRKKSPLTVTPSDFWIFREYLIMLKAKYSSSANHKIVRQNNRFSRFLIFRRRLQAQRKDGSSDRENHHPNCITAKNFGNDVFVSCSGQKKINSSLSCRDLSSCDFIVF